MAHGSSYANARIMDGQESIGRGLPGVDRQRSALWHGLDGVEYKIGKDLAQLRCVARNEHAGLSLQVNADGLSLRVQPGGTPDSIPLMPNEFHGVLHEISKIQQFAGQLVAPPAGEILNAPYRLGGIGCAGARRLEKAAHGWIKSLTQQ